MNVCPKHYEHCEWKRWHIASNTNILNGKEFLPQTCEVYFFYLFNKQEK